MGDKQKQLDKVVADLHKRFGDGAIMKLGDTPNMSVESISTGALNLDLALGIGGIPRGRVTEIYGPEASGKTTLCQHIIAEAQKAGGMAAFIDAEHALDRDYAQCCGVDVANLYVAQPESGEVGLEILETLVRSEALDVVVVDSVAALTPRGELEGDMGDAHMGLQARLMSQALRKLAAVIKKSNTAVVFTNQLRMKIGLVFGNPETTTGGRALRFYASVRLDIRAKQKIKNGPDVVGSHVRVKVAKNKVAPPFKEAEFDIMYNEGLSKPGIVLDMAVAADIINKRGSYYSYGEENLAQGHENAKAYLRQHPEVLEQLEQTIRTQFNILKPS